MKVFIFGAGASLGSQIPGYQISADKKAPLVDQLFDDPYRNYANDVGMSGSDFHSFKIKTGEVGSVEKCLTDMWADIEKIRTDSTRQAELKKFGAFTFYIWRLFQEVSTTYDLNNCYVLFLEKVKKRDEEFGLISFNYDTLLDKAYEDVISYSLTNLEAYLKARFIKPHGSVNWFLQRRGDDQIFSGIERTVDYSARFKLAGSQMLQKSIPISNMQVLPPSHDDLRNPRFIVTGSSHDQFYYPLVLLPLTTKLYKLFEGFNEKIINEGRKLMQVATEIYLIGYRAEDEIIKDMFKNLNRRTTVNVIGIEDANLIMDKIMVWYPDLKQGEVHSQGFHSYVTNKM